MLHTVSRGLEPHVGQDCHSYNQRCKCLDLDKKHEYAVERCMLDMSHNHAVLSGCECRVCMDGQAGDQFNLGHRLS